MDFLKRFFAAWRARRVVTGSTTFDEYPLDASDIDFSYEPLNGDEVGVVYIVSNDYHSEERMALSADLARSNLQKMVSFFTDQCDKYYVEAKKSATSKKFLATCKYLADFENYPKNCNKIIIYFSGRGKGNHIIMEKDYSIKISANGWTAREKEKVDKNSIVTIENILSIFRGQVHHDRGKDVEEKKMEKISRILLLDACCSAESESICKENELVACAGSDKSNAMNEYHTCGLWTKELCECKELSEGNHCTIENLLDIVQQKMKKNLYVVDADGTTEHLFPSYRSNLRQQKIMLQKKSMYISHMCMYVVIQ